MLAIAVATANATPPPAQEPTLRLKIEEADGASTAVVLMPDGRCDYTPAGGALVQLWLDKRTKAALFKTLDEQKLGGQPNIQLTATAPPAKPLLEFIATWIAPMAQQKQKQAETERARQQAARQQDRPTAALPEGVFGTIKADNGYTVGLDDGGQSVVALDTASGKMLWKVNMTGPAAAVRVEGNRVIVAPQNWTVDLATGKILSR